MILTSKIYAQADCNSLGDCISDPVSGTRGGNTFSDLSTATVFAINFTLYIVQGFLLVLIVYSLFMTIYSLMKSDTDEDFSRVRSGVTNAIIAVVSIIILISSKFFFITILRFFGIEDSANPFF